MSVGVNGYPLFVYPKYNTKTASRFARTAWSCPETALVVGTPALLAGDVREGHNIQLQSPSVPGQPVTDPIDEAASTYGVSRERLLQVLNIDEQVLQEVPEEWRRLVLIDALQTADLSELEANAAPSPPTQPSSTRTASGSESASLAPLGARPADVAAGRRLLSSGAHSLLIEKFDFERRSAEAVLTLGVRDSLEVCNPPRDVAEDNAPLAQRLEQLVTTRTAALLEDAQSNAVYTTSECVVCMESSPPPDTILYQCGHRCVHLHCVRSGQLRRCPLCRSLVVAILPVASPPPAAAARTTALRAPSRPRARR